MRKHVRYDQNNTQSSKDDVANFISQCKRQLLSRTSHGSSQKKTKSYSIKSRQNSSCQIKYNSSNNNTSYVPKKLTSNKDQIQKRNKNRSLISQKLQIDKKIDKKVHKINIENQINIAMKFTPIKQLKLNPRQKNKVKFINFLNDFDSIKLKRSQNKTQNINKENCLQKQVSEKIFQQKKLFKDKSRNYYSSAVKIQKINMENYFTPEKVKNSEASNSNIDKLSKTLKNYKMQSYKEIQMKRYQRIKSTMIKISKLKQYQSGYCLIGNCQRQYKSISFSNDLKNSQNNQIQNKAQQKISYLASQENIISQNLKIRISQKKVKSQKIKAKLMKKNIKQDKIPLSNAQQALNRLSLKIIQSEQNKNQQKQIIKNQNNFNENLTPWDLQTSDRFQEFFIKMI